jgi:membrane protease YdiL (CAAX protease family)
LGEDTGWRGFLLPRLLEKYSPLTASLILGLIWAVRHIPLDYSAYSQRVLRAAEFTLHVLCLSVLMTILTLNTRGSILLAMIVHWSNNISHEFASVIFPAGGIVMPNRLYEILLVILSAALRRAGHTELDLKSVVNWPQPK